MIGGDVLLTAVCGLGALAVAIAWRSGSDRPELLWAYMTGVSGVLGLVALGSGRVHLSPAVEPMLAVLVGLGIGVLLYLATAVFVVSVRRWEAFDRKVAELYGARRQLSVPVAILLGAIISGSGEELFWRGLLQWRLADWLDPVPAALAAWALWVLVYLASGSLPIIAGAIVAGGVWSGLSLWTHGALASVCCHVAWTALMLAIPPGRTARGAAMGLPAGG